MMSQAEAGLSQQIKNLLAFAGGSGTPSDAIFIAVMGVTGAGKSTLISQCTGQNVDVGHDLVSCTSEIGVFDFELGGRTVYLIDTPGNFTERPDFVILQSISAYLSASYARHIYIHGVIFLHRITENRVTGSARRNIELMKAICGSGFFPYVALATTHWMTGGAALFRQDDGAASACQIVEYLINKNKQLGETPALAIQRELVDMNKRLDDTTAGKVVLDVAARKYAAAKEEIAALKLAIKESDDETSKVLHEMKEENEKIMRELEKTENQMAIRAQEITRKEQELIIQKLHDAHMQSKAQLEAHERELSQLKEEKRQLQRKASAESKRRLSNKTPYHEPPPRYEEAAKKMEAQVVEKQAEVAVAKQRSLKEDIAIAAIPAALAAGKS
ncbi:hypothetical protein N7462_004760 [Penicillium macrosclerotiorum]|uniref:uncharacterized protein n=1 Tax=Penicillium macrosclerotiorum TaxID=303699 RepID=UPI002546997D|nr:uncharacterized protein N7462_004760 [Penicillium macrosclerotiorum]KAJ5690368.1 hypothetical protein N7462_004760 [Penicillium macrosclerotiorum]